MTELAVFCSDKIDFRSRQMQTCPTTADKTTTPYPHPTPISENSSANGCSRSFELFSFFSCFQQKKFFGGGGHVPPAHPPRTPMPTRQFGRDWCVCVCVCVCVSAAGSDGSGGELFAGSLVSTRRTLTTLQHRQHRSVFVTSAELSNS